MMRTRATAARQLKGLEGLRWAREHDCPARGIRRHVPFAAKGGHLQVSPVERGPQGRALRQLCTRCCERARGV